MQLRSIWPLKTCPSYSIRCVEDFTQRTPRNAPISTPYLDDNVEHFRGGGIDGSDLTHCTRFWVDLEVVGVGAGGAADERVMNGGVYGVHVHGLDLFRRYV